MSSGRLSRKRRLPDSGPSCSTDNKLDITDDFSDETTSFRAPKKPKNTKHSLNSQKATLLSNSNTDVNKPRRGSNSSTNSLVSQETTEIFENAKNATCILTPVPIVTIEEDDNDLLPITTLNADKITIRPGILNKRYGLRSKESTSNVPKENHDTFHIGSITASHYFSEKKTGTNLSHQTTINEPPQTKTFSSSTTNAQQAEEDALFSELEKSVCAENEKLCPCCKHIVGCAHYDDHLRTCLNRFKYDKDTKNSTKKDQRTFSVQTTFTSAQNPDSGGCLALFSKPTNSEPRVEKSPEEQCEDYLHYLYAGTAVKAIKSDQAAESVPDTAPPQTAETSPTSYMVKITRGATKVPAIKASRRGGGRGKRKQSTVLRNTSAAQRNNAVKARLKSVLAAATDDVTESSASHCDDDVWEPVDRGSTRLSRVLNREECMERTLWSVSNTDLGGVQQYRVKELAPLLGEAPAAPIVLHRHLSQIPGRLSATMNYDPDEPQEEMTADSPFNHSGKDTTQMLLAQLLDSQMSFNLSWCGNAASPGNASLLFGDRSAMTPQSELFGNVSMSSSSLNKEKQSKLFPPVERSKKSSLVELVCDKQNISEDGNNDSIVKNGAPVQVDVDSRMTKKIEVVSLVRSPEGIDNHNISNGSITENDSDVGSLDKTVLFESPKLLISDVKNKIINDPVTENGSNCDESLDETVIYESANLATSSVKNETNCKYKESPPDRDCKDEVSSQNSRETQPFNDDLAPTEIIPSRDSSKCSTDDGALTVPFSITKEDGNKEDLTVQCTVPESDSNETEIFDDVVGPNIVASGSTRDCLVSQLSVKNVSRFSNLGTCPSQQKSDFMLEKYLSTVANQSFDPLPPPEKSETATEPFVDENLIDDKKNTKTQCSLVTNLIDDWANLLSSEEGSDVIIISQGKEIKAHSFVFMVRCKPLYLSMQSSNTQLIKSQTNCAESVGNISKRIEWEVSFKAAKAFIRYIYTGQIPKLDCSEPIKYDLLQLCSNYHCNDLKEFLETNTSGDTGDITEISSTTSHIDVSSSKSFTLMQTTASVDEHTLNPIHKNDNKIINTSVKTETCDKKSIILPDNSQASVDNKNASKLKNINPGSIVNEMNNVKHTPAVPDGTVNPTLPGTPKIAAKHNLNNTKQYDSGNIMETTNIPTNATVRSPSPDMFADDDSECSTEMIENDNVNFPTFTEKNNVGTSTESNNVDIVGVPSASYTENCGGGSISRPSDSKKDDIKVDVVDISLSDSNESMDSLPDIHNLPEIKQSYASTSSIARKNEINPGLESTQKSHQMSNANASRMESRQETSHQVSNMTDLYNKTTDNEAEDDNNYVCDVWDDFDEGECHQDLIIIPCEPEPVPSQRNKSSLDKENLQMCKEVSKDIIACSPKEVNPRKRSASPVRFVLNSTELDIGGKKNARLDISSSCPNMSRISMGSLCNKRVNVIGQSSVRDSPNSKQPPDTVDPKAMFSDDTWLQLEEELARDWNLEDDGNNANSAAHDNLNKSLRSRLNNVNRLESPKNVVAPCWKGNRRKNSTPRSSKTNSATSQNNEIVSGIPTPEQLTNVSTPTASRAAPRVGGRVEQLRQQPPSTPSSLNSSTAITPRPDYSAMPSPQLKRVLEQYGIRPLSRNKARALLNHIYEQTHPIVPDTPSPRHRALQRLTPAGSSPVPTSTPVGTGRRGVHRAQVALQQKHSNPPRQTNAESADINRREQQPPALEEIIQLELQQPLQLLEMAPPAVIDLSQSDEEDSDGGCPEESLLGDSSQDESAGETIEESGDLHTRLRSLILSDAGLHRAVLLYQPLWLHDVKQLAKQRGIKCSGPQLVHFLDSQCITFRMGNGATGQPRNRQKKPAKKNSAKR